MSDGRFAIGVATPHRRTDRTLARRQADSRAHASSVAAPVDTDGRDDALFPIEVSLATVAARNGG